MTTATEQIERYSLADVLRLINLDEGTFWSLYRAGMIPPGCWIPGELSNVLWDSHTIDEWLKRGRPAMPGVLEQQARIFNSLRGEML